MWRCERFSDGEIVTREIRAPVISTRAARIPRSEDNSSSIFAHTFSRAARAPWDVIVHPLELLENAGTVLSGEKHPPIPGSNKLGFTRPRRLGNHYLNRKLYRY